MATANFPEKQNEPASIKVSRGLVSQFITDRLPSRETAATLARDNEPSFKKFAETTDYKHITTTFDADNNAIWAATHGQEKLCYSNLFLQDALHLLNSMSLQIMADRSAGKRSIDYLVWTSSMPGVWNMGGDLELFMDCIRKKDRERLRTYAFACVDVVYTIYNGLDVDLPTICVVQGAAFAGGFEGALAGQIMIAEKSAQFGFPEILFSLFPGMGASSILSRRLSPAMAEKMIKTGKTYSALELADLGLVDVVCEDGKGLEAARAYMKEHARKYGTLAALAKIRRKINPLTQDELRDITNIWVETAMLISDADLRRMERLEGAQRKKIIGAAH